MKRIVCPAIVYDDKKNHLFQPAKVDTGICFSGLTMKSCFSTFSAFENKAENIDYNELYKGFLTSDNEFVFTEEANKIALDSGQITTKVERHSELEKLIKL